MDAGQAGATRAECVRRVLTRRRPPTERIQRGARPEGDVESRQVEGSEFLDPADIGEWVDDRLASLPWIGPHTAVLYEVAAAARTSEKAALAAMRAGARQLRTWDQFHCYEMLEIWRASAGTLPAARALMNQLTDAFEDDHKLCSARPDWPEQEMPEPPPAEKLTYETRFGNPAGLSWSR
jgi:hypothetical protein